jgi:hypothetical protein
MSISAIPPTSSITSFPPVNAANAPAPATNVVTNPPVNLTNPVTSPAATSTTIAQTYGFAPSLIVPIYQPAFYQASSQNPDVVTGVARIEVVPRVGQNSGGIFDAFA